MRKIIERPKALEDLDGIADYIAVDNPDAALRVISAVADTYLHIVEWPELSKLVDKRLRLMPVVGFRQYLVIYTWSDDVVEILRVIRADQDYLRVLGF